MKNKPLFLIVIFLLILILILLGVWVLNVDYMLPGGNLFCLDKGYDSTSWGGGYSEKYGKVKCVSCYDGDCVYEEFNVTKKFGIVMEDEK